MARYWEIRESLGERSYKDEVSEAYECGYEEGYEAALEEMEGKSHMGMREDRYTSRRKGNMAERDGMERSYMGERRSRDSMGRFR